MYRISSNNSPGAIAILILIIIRDDHSRDAIISNIVHWKSCSSIFCFIIPLNKLKNSNK